MSEPKVVITGTGRAGSTLLVQVLDALGADVGLSDLAPPDPRTHAGLERVADDPDAPRIVKDMVLVPRFDALLRSGEISVAHVIVPIRALETAAASRVRASRYGEGILARGGLFGTFDPAKQQMMTAYMLYELVWTIARHELPHTFIEFPRFAHDAEYLHREIGFLTPDRTVDDYAAALKRFVRDDWIHETPLDEQEEKKVRSRSFRVKFDRKLRKYPDWDPSKRDQTDDPA